MIHGCKVAGVESLILGNPWVSTDEIRSAVLRKHYVKRLGDVHFWQKLIRFEYNLLDYAMAGVQKVTARFARLLSPRTASRMSSQVAANVEGGGRATDSMLAGLRQFKGPVLFLMSGRSLVSNEFDELISGDPAWQSVYSRPAIKRMDLPNADQTFSDGDSRERVNQAILDWVVGLRER
jgi:hypothetical protein